MNNIKTIENTQSLTSFRQLSSSMAVNFAFCSLSFYVVLFFGAVSGDKVEGFSTDHSKVVPLPLFFLVCASVVSFVFILCFLLSPFYLCFGKVVPCVCGIAFFWIFSIIFFLFEIKSKLAYVLDSLTGSKMDLFKCLGICQ